MNFSPIFPSIWRKWLAVVLALTSAITFFGCNPTEFKTASAEVPQMVSSVLSDPKTFNFALNQESPNIFGLTYEGLVSENALTGEIEPALAQSWEISEDKKKIIMTLREGLKWSDGEPLTAEDVVYTYNDIYLNKAIPTDARDILRIGESRALP